MGAKRAITLIVLAVLVAGLCPAVALAADGGLTAISPRTQEEGTQPKVALELISDSNLLYSDGEAKLKVTVGEIEGAPGDWELAVEVGQVFTFDDEAGTFEHALVAGDAYTFDADTGILTIAGEKALAALDGWGGPHAVVVRARIVRASTHELYGDAGEYEAIESIQVMLVRVDYDRESDCNLLPDWTGWVDSQRTVYVENSSFPDGMNFDYEITDVRVASEPTAGGEPVVSIEAMDGGWEYRAQNYGTATIEVEYVIPDELGGGRDSYSFEVCVASDVYDVWIDSKTGSGIALPGGSIELAADCTHDFNDDSQFPDEEFTYEWTLLDGGEEFASINPKEGDSSEATVTFRELRDDEPQGGFWENVRVKVVLRSVQDTENAERASADIELDMASEYTEIWPTRNNRRLAPGGEETLDIELRSYPGRGEGGYDVVQDVQLRWDYVDTNCVSILDANGEEVANQGDATGTRFTIKRLKSWRTDFKLVAEWGDDGYTDRWFGFDELNMDIWLDSETDKVFDDGVLDLKLGIDEALDADNVNYTVGLWDGDANEGAGDWAQMFGEGSGWSASADNKTVTLDGAALLARSDIDDCAWIRVSAELALGGDVVGSCDRWIQVREARADYDRHFDQSMLPGWANRIDATSAVWVENSAHPDGEQLEYTVTGVAVESQEPAGEGPVVAVEEKTDDGHYWLFTAQAHGKATLKVTYAVPDELGGGTESYSFDVFVGADVYVLELDKADGGPGIGGPGGSIALVAAARHYAEEGGDEDGQVALREPRFTWQLRNDDFAEIEVDPSDQTKATVTFKELPEGETERFEDVWVEVRLFESLNEDELAFADCCLRVETRGDISNCEFKLVDDGSYAAMDGSWALAFVQGGTATFTPKVELYDGNELVDPYVYTVRYERIWWEGDERKSEFVDAISTTGQDNFRIVIEPSPCGCYVGTYDRETAEIQVVNEFNLGTSYTDMYFDEFPGVVDDRINGMNPNYHVVPAGIVSEYLASLKVRTGGEFSIEENTHNGRLLDPSNYNVKYYKADPAKRTAAPPEEHDSLGSAREAIVGGEIAQPSAPGSYVIEVAGVDPYFNSNYIYLDIRADAADVAVARIPDQEYTGAAISPQLTVTCNGHKLVEGLHYKATYANNTAAGTATVTLSGLNPVMHWGWEQGPDGLIVVWTPGSTDRFFGGTKTVTFSIVKPAWETTYTWAKDYSSVTATRTCTNSDDFEQQTETAKATSTVTKKATLKAAGEIAYTSAAFKDAAFAKQVKTVAIAKNNMTVKASAKTAKLAKVKKRAQTLRPITVKNAKGKMSYKLAGGNAKSKKALSVNKKTGKITVKKGTKKGTYSIKAKAASAATANYAAASITVTVKVKVK